MAAVDKLFDEIAPRFADRPGGYTRIVKLGTRAGDGAEVAIIELIGSEVKRPVKEKVPVKETGEGTRQGLLDRLKRFGRGGEEKPAEPADE